MHEDIREWEIFLRVILIAATREATGIIKAEKKHPQQSGNV